MPQIQPYIFENINTLINLSLVLTKVNEVSFRKAMYFVSATTMIYLLNFLWVVIVTLFMNKPLSTVGSDFFIVHAVWDFTVILGYFLIILVYGSEANNTDFELKDIMIKI